MIVWFFIGFEWLWFGERLIGCEEGNEFCFDVEILCCGVFVFWDRGFDMIFLRVIGEEGFFEIVVIFFLGG